MATSSSAAIAKPRHLLNPFHPTSAPPPTPSTQPNHSSTSDSAAADTLSRLLHRLPPNLSLPTRRLSPRAITSTTPSNPLPSATSTSPLSTSTLELGYFQLTHHTITPQRAESAESEAVSLFDLPHDKKLALFPKEWPLGFDQEDDHDDHHETDTDTASFCLDGACSTTTTVTSDELRLASLRELTRELERLGMEVVESLASAVGFENPFGKKEEEGVAPSSLMWISEEGDKEGRVYPYVVGLQYQIRPRKWSLLSDTGSVTVEPQVGSVLVTLGDIAQVWSKRKLKKVRGRPSAISEEKSKSPNCISMTLLLTLPLESTVSPLLMIPGKIEALKAGNNDQDKGKSHDEYPIMDDQEASRSNINQEDDQRVFNSFTFEDYAWRVYHERIPLKDPLDRYRLID